MGVHEAGFDAAAPCLRRTVQCCGMSHGARVWVALVDGLLIWGSTYLGIELDRRDDPAALRRRRPLRRGGASDARLHRVAAWHRGSARHRRELASCAVIGALLPGANAVLFVAERHVPIGLASLIIGAVPLWIVLLRTVTGDRPPSRVARRRHRRLRRARAPRAAERRRAALGAAARRLLVRGDVGDGVVSVGPAAAAADSFAATSYEMLAGGLILLPIGLATTHPHFSQFSGRSIFGFFYLVTFGSVVGYTAYVWLLDNAPLGSVATYAYVNPVVAIALGAIVLHESITWTIGLGAVLVLACVAPVVRQESIRK